MKAKANLFRTLVVLPVVLVAVAVALFGVGLRTAETQTTTPKMQVQDLGTLGASSFPMGINDSGQVVGYSMTSIAGNTVPRAFLYDEGATPKMQDLGTLGGANSRASGINDSGMVVGWSDTSDGEQHAFIYDASAPTPKMQDLNDLIPADSGWTIDEATAINSDGKIVANDTYRELPPPGGESVCQGYGESYPYYGAAFVLTPATTATYEMQDLGTLGGDWSGAYGLNDSGQVVGRSMTSDCGDHAFLYNASATPKMQDLGTLEGGNYSRATGVNDLGQVVGYSNTWTGVLGDNAYSHAFIYDESATPKMQDMHDLGTLRWNSSDAWSINDSGQVVGESSGGDGVSYAFIYDESATPKIQELNTLIPADSGWSIRDAKAINTNGMIAATGDKDGVGRRALLLTPTGDSSPPADSEAPTVMDSSLMPASGATGVARNTSVAATFSEAIDPKTLVTTPKDPANPNVGTSTTFTLVKDGTTKLISATVSYKDSTDTVTLTPSTNLARNTKYTAKITGGVKDLAGNALANAPYTWSFTTGSK